MPVLSDAIEDKTALLRVLCYGPAKTKKTWWAGRAAEAGFNVLLLNGDDGAHILNNIRKDAQDRIRIVHCYDKLDRPIMGGLVARFMRGDTVIWDDTDNKMVKAFTAGHAHFMLEAKKLTPKDVLIIDSWTALAWSVKWDGAKTRNIDLSENLDKTDWDVYGDTGRFLDWTLAQLSGLNCHLVVIGHAEQYDKYKKKADGKMSSEIEWSRIQPISSSRPHGMRLAKHFSDVLQFKMTGTNYYVDTTAYADRDGGSRNAPPKNWPWDELTFEKFCESSHAAVPGPDAAKEMPAAVFYAVGETPATVTTATTVTKPATDNVGTAAPTLQAATAAAQTAKPGFTLAALAKKPTT